MITMVCAAHRRYSRCVIHRHTGGNAIYHGNTETDPRSLHLLVGGQHRTCLIVNDDAEILEVSGHDT